MKKILTRFIAVWLMLLLASQLVTPSQISAATKVIEELPQPEWTYKLPAGYVVWNPVDFAQTKDRFFFPLLKTVKISASKSKSSSLAYASVSRLNKSDPWIHDYSDIANDTTNSGSNVYYAKDGYSYFYKKINKTNAYKLSAVDPKGKLKWSKTIDYWFDLVLLDNNNILISSISYSSAPGGSPRSFIEYNHDGKEVRKFSITNSPVSTGIVAVLPNGYVQVHDHSGKTPTTLIYRNLNNLKKPILQYNASVNISPFTDGSFMFVTSDKNISKIVGYDLNGKKKWVRILKKGDSAYVIGDRIMIKNDNSYEFYSKDNKFVGKQKIGESGDTAWIHKVTSSGDIMVEKQYQWQERPAVIDPTETIYDYAKEDVYILDPKSSKITYYLSTLWDDLNVGHNYFYAGNGEFYISGIFQKGTTIKKYTLK